MNSTRQSISILIADDDADDRLLAKDALTESRLVNDVFFVEDGEETMDFLHKKGKYTDTNIPKPGLILLDLNMPRKDGWEVLEEIKKDSNLRSIPVVVLTTSKAEEDIVRTYDLGVSSFIVKPVTFEALVDVMNTISLYWFEIVRLPHRERDSLS
jgi:CheY-like chemotaxis protein